MNGVYVMVIDGDVTIENKNLAKRDAFGIKQTEVFDVIFSTNSQLLFIEVPMRY